MGDKLTEDIQSIVDSIFKQKEELDMRKETENALNKSAEKINELTSSLEAKDGELNESATKLDELNSLISETVEKNKGLEESLKKATSDFEAEKEELVKKAETAEEGFLNMKKDQLSQARYAELESEGVAAIEDRAKEDQIGKIRDMGDDEFTAYKDERAELRKSVVAELEASTKEKTAEEIAAEKAAAEGKLSEEEKAAKEAEAEAARIKAEEEAAAASADSIDPMKAVAGMLNMEKTPDKNMLSKYRELGKTMAKKYIETSE